MVKPRIFPQEDGITAVDSELLRPGHAAVHIVEQAGRAAIVDTGSNTSVPFVLAALEQLGLSRGSVDFLLLTHVHLDHAGGAGELMAALPNASAVLHPRGAPHMVEPDRLEAASRSTFGPEAYDRMYGNLVPIDSARIRTTEDGERLDWNGRELVFLHTPGHALHHQAIVDAGHGNIFTGDTFGLSYRECDSSRGAFMFPTTTPTQFDPDQLIASIRRLAGLHPRAMYLTHFSRVTGVPRLAGAMEHAVREFVRIARQHARAADRRAAIREDLRRLLLQLAHEHGCRLSDDQIEALFELDLELNTDGLIAWLQRSEKGIG
jgi:glyoxylase-like metal-dependent hydrolase (beta-lactamase superfamily II)